MSGSSESLDCMPLDLAQCVLLFPSRRPGGFQVGATAGELLHISQQKQVSHVVY